MKNIEANTLLPTQIYKSRTEEISTFDKGHKIFQTNVPRKTQCGKTDATTLEGFMIMYNFEYKLGCQ